MSFPVFIPTEAVSRYSLLGAMSREVAGAFAAAGCVVNPPDSDPAFGKAGFHLFLNFPDSYEGLAAWAGVGRRRGALLNYFVDHPLAMSADLLDRLSTLTNYRLLLACADDVHLLRLRWPSLKVAHCPHGVPTSALCDAAGLKASHAAGGSRDIDVLVAGWVHPRAEVERLLGNVPHVLRAPAEEAVRLMLAHPWMSFGQAADLSLPNGVWTPNAWGLLQAVWRYSTAALNRERRLLLVAALQGVNATVIGSPAWAEVCTGTLEYRGEQPYEALPAWMARARVCLAWGPTQFVHSFSERLLVSLAAGCGTVADDRLLVRRHFDAAGCLRTFDAARPEACREAVESLLRDRALCAAAAAKGRAEVAAKHLWGHRLELMVRVGAEAIGAV